MCRLFAGLLAAAAAAVLPQFVLADDQEKPDAPGARVERPDLPPGPAGRPGPPRDHEADRDRPGPARGPLPGGPMGWGDRSERPWWMDGQSERSDRGERPESARRGPRPDGPPRGPEGWQRGEGRPGGPPSGGRGPGPGERPDFAARGPRPGGPGPGPAMPDPADIFKRLDRNGDKQLSVEEFTDGLKRLHEGVAAFRQRIAGVWRPPAGPPHVATFHYRGGPRGGAAFWHRGGPPPGAGMQHGRGPFGPGLGMAPPQVRQRIASLPPEARKKALEAMKERWHDQGAKADAAKGKGKEAAKDKDRGKARPDAEVRKDKPKDKEPKEGK